MDDVGEAARQAHLDAMRDVHETTAKVAARLWSAAGLNPEDVWPFGSEVRLSRSAAEKLVDICDYASDETG